MNKDSCYQLGYIVRQHGLKGELKAIFETDNPSNYKGMESVFVEIEQKLIPFFIESIRQTGEYYILKIEDIDSYEEAENLLRSSLWLPLEFLPELKGNDFYYHDIIGFDAIDGENTKLGIIKDYYSSGPQNLLSIDHGGKEILIPVVKEFIKKVDKSNKVLYFNLPDGLIDLYME